MEAAYSSCNSLNYPGKQKWCSKSFDCETGKVYDKHNDVLNTLKECNADCIDVSTSNRPGLEPSAEFNGITGKGVLLWLPPRLESYKGNQDVPPSHPKHSSIGKNVFLNVYPTGQDETRLALDNGRGQAEKRCLVNLIGANLDEEDNRSDLTLEDGLATVIDLSVLPGLISKIQTQEEVDYFCQKILEHFRNISRLPSHLHLECNDEHPTKHHYYIVYNVLSRVKTLCNANSALSCEYLSESPKKSHKTRKAGKKSKRESTVFGNEKKSKFTFDALIGSQIKILGYQNFNYKVLEPSVTELKEDGKECVTAATSSVSKNNELIIEVDLSGIEVPSGLKVDVNSSFLILHCSSGVFNTHMKLKLPKCYTFPKVENVPYHCNDGIMFLNIKVQNLELVSTNKKLLYHSASVDSGIGSDEFCLSTLSSILPEMTELDELADEAALSWPQIDVKTTGAGFAALTEHRLLNTFATESSSRKLEEKSGQSINQNCIRDRITSKNLPVCVGTLLPTYEVSQTKSAIYFNVLCGVGIEIASLQVCTISPHFISISYTNAGACSTPLRYCMHISSVDIEQENCSSEKCEKFQSFKYEIEEQTNSILNGVHLLESTLVVGIEKTTAGFWEAVWAGDGGNFRKLIIIKKEEQTKPHLKLEQAPEPRRLGDRNSTDGSTGALPRPDDDDTAPTRALNGSQEKDATHDDERSQFSSAEKTLCDILPKARENSGRKHDQGSKEQQGPRPKGACQGGGEGECEVSAVEVGKTLNSLPSNVNAKTKFEDVMLAASKNGNDQLRTKQTAPAASASSAHSTKSSKPNVNGTSSSNNKKKNNLAVKNYMSPVDDKENQACVGDDEEDEVFENRGVQGGETKGCASFSALKNGVPRCQSSDWPAHDGKRLRRSSECITSATRKASGGGSKDPSSPPLQGIGYRPRGILKRRGRSLSESHIGSLEECLGEELLGKYGSVERALVGEYGCLEGLMEECGWDEEEDDDGATKGGDESGLSGGKKSVRFSDVEKCHLFMSKASIVNQLANDDKKAMRMKMKEQKKKIRLEKRQAQKSGHSFSSGSNNSSYRDNNGYNSFDDDVTTEESDGAELISTSSGGDTTDNTEDETEAPARSTVAELNQALLLNRNNKGGKKRGGGKKNNKKKRGVELTNNLIFQLDMEA